jgi:hypothetical protein
MKQNKKREKQKKLHDTQLGDITQYIKSVSKKKIKRETERERERQRGREERGKR